MRQDRAATPRLQEPDPVGTDRVGRRGHAPIPAKQRREHRLALPAGAVTVDAAGATATPGKPIELKVTVNRNLIPPGQYTGNVYLTIPGQGTVTLPVDVIVRMGPGLALFLVVAGVLIGQLYKWAQGAGAARVAMRQRQNELAHRATRLTARDESLLADALAHARQLVFDGRTPLAEALLAKIESRIDALERVETIEKIITEWADGDPKTKATAEIASVRAAIGAGNDAAAAAGLADLQTSVTAPPVAAEASPVSRKLAEHAAGEALAMAKKAAATRVAAPAVRFFRSLPGRASALKTEAAVWLLPPLTWLILVSVLVDLGMRACYTGVVFGADLGGNIVAALVFGFTADALSRAITTALPLK